jgi:hypothetical protein
MAEDGRTAPEVTEGTCSAHPASRTIMGERQDGGRTLLEGVAIPLRGRGVEEGWERVA